MQHQVSRKQEVYVPDSFLLGQKDKDDLYNQFIRYLWDNSLTACCPCCNMPVDYGQPLMLCKVEGSPRLAHLSCLDQALQKGLYILNHEAIFKMAEEHDDQLRREEEKRQKEVNKSPHHNLKRGKAKKKTRATRRLSLHKGPRAR